MACNFDPGLPLVDDQNKDWNFNGTTEFSLYDTMATSVVGSDGIATSLNNFVVADSRKRPYGKIVDFDVDHQGTSVVYGMTFSLVQANTDDTETVVFAGNWHPNMVSQNMWPRKK